MLYVHILDKVCQIFIVFKLCTVCGIEYVVQLSRFNGFIEQVYVLVFPKLYFCWCGATAYGLFGDNADKRQDGAIKAVKWTL